MSTIRINPYGAFGRDAYGRGAQCFRGKLVADRVDVAATTSFPAPNQPAMTIGNDVFYIAVLLTQPGLVYAGPPNSDMTVVAKRAQSLPAGWWPMSVDKGDVVFVADL